MTRVLNGVLLIHSNLLIKEVLNSSSQHIKERLRLLHVLSDLQLHCLHGSNWLVLQ